MTKWINLDHFLIYLILSVEVESRWWFMDTITKGRLGYNLLEKELLKRDWELFTPLLENGKIDLIAIKNNKILKFQIKTMGLDKRYNIKYLPIRKISHNQGEYKIHFYTAEEIDYFVGSDIENEILYIVPINFVQKYTSRISENTLQVYKNNFSQLEK